MYMKKKSSKPSYVRCDESGHGHYMVIKCKNEAQAFEIKELCERLDFIRKIEICDLDSNEWNHSGEFYKSAKSFKKVLTF